MPARCESSHAALRFVSHWFGDVPNASPEAHVWMFKFSQVGPRWPLKDLIHEREDILCLENKSHRALDLVQVHAKLAIV